MVRRRSFPGVHCAERVYEVPMCHRCEDLMLRSRSRYRVRLLDMEAFQQRCSICSLCLRSISAFYPNTGRISKGEVNVSFRVGRLCTEFDWLHDEVAGEYQPKLLEFRSEMDHVKLYPEHFASEKCMSLIRRWLSECETKHPHPMCRRPHASALPARILDLENNTEVARLVESRGKVDKYVALSHC